MATILTVLCSLYGVYCISFCSTMCYTIYKENRDERVKKNVEIRHQYNILQMNGLSQTGIIRTRNVRLTPITEVNEYVDLDIFVDTNEGKFVN